MESVYFRITWCILNGKYLVMSTKDGSNLNKPKSSMDISALLKEVYPKPKKRKTRSKRWHRIERVLDIIPKD